MHPPRVVVIGYGFAGRCFHSYLVGLTPGLVLHGVASRTPETRARIVAERGCRAYASVAEVLRDPEVDAVVVATPNSTHAALAVQALRAGKHVITDKIMCLSLRECDRMIAAAAQAGRVLTVFQNRRWDGDFLTLRQLMDTGRLGDVRWLEMAWQGFGPWGGWRGQAAMGGGRFLDLGAHVVDQLLLLFPQAVTSVYCRQHHDYPGTDVESHSLLVVGFADGRTGVCDMSGVNAVSKPRFYACGTAGAFVKYGVDPQEAAMIAGHIDTAQEDPQNYGRLNDGKTEQTIPTLAGRWRNYYENVAAVLTTGAAPAVKLPEVRRAMAVFDAAARSARSGRAIKVNIPAAE